MSILLIRHGETAYNAARIAQLPETPLNERGIRQAERLAERLAEFPIGGIVASDYKRAHMTAESIGAVKGLEVTLSPSLRERHFGENRGKPYRKLGFDMFAPDYHPPGGESWEQFHQRVTEAWSEVRVLAEETEGYLAVVTHALVCRSLVSNHFELADDLEPEVPRWANTALTIVERRPTWRVSLLACAAHLHGESADDTAGHS
jgi:probable phosphoglycerate mutase